MKTYFAVAALLYSLVSAVDLLDNDDLVDNADLFDDGELFEDDASENEGPDYSHVFAQLSDLPPEFDEEMIYNGNRYLHSARDRTYPKAAKICEKYGGSMLTIRDDATLEQVQNFLPDLNGNIVTAEKTWIGLRKRGRRYWYWSDTKEPYTGAATKLTWRGGDDDLDKSGK